MLVSIVRGANGPLLERTITSELKNEHDVLEKGASRKSVSLCLSFKKYSLFNVVLKSELILGFRFFELFF